MLLPVHLMAALMLGASTPSTPASDSAFVTVRNGHFYRGDERVRFWGVNLVDDPDRTRTEIAHVARRIRRCGFNAVRLHLYDFRLIDTDRADTRQFRSYSRGDNSLPDRFDYMIYCLKREGLALYMTFDRARVGFVPGDYDILPDTGDREAWGAAITETKNGWGAKQLWYVDDRLAALHREYAESFLNHVNQYTGTAYRDEPAIAIYEVSNENEFPEVMLKGDWDTIPAYFRDELRREWNDWLRAKYGGEAGILASWGALADGESLDGDGAELAPSYDEANDYPEARRSDIVAFIYDRTNRTNDEFVAFVRRLGQPGRGISVAPICYDTFCLPVLAWHYPASRGDFTCGGMYFSAVGDEPNAPLYPWQAPLSEPPRLYHLGTATVADKPFVIYETNIFRPARYRADFPMRLATYGSWQDWDGVFFYVWDDGVIKRIASDEDYTKQPLEYRSSYLWHGIVFGTDEILLSQMRVAGEVFKHFLLRPAPDPTLFTFGEDRLTSMDWHYYGGYGSYYDWIYRTSFVHGARIRFDPDGPSRTDGAIVKDPPTSRLRTSPEILWDFGRGRLVLNAPGVRAALGFLGGAADVRGLSASGISPDYTCLAVASTDGRALEDCHEAVLSLVSTSDNTGFVFDPEKMRSAPEGVDGIGAGVVSWGELPVEVVRPSATIELPWARGMTATKLDFAFREFSRQAVEGPLTVSSSDPLFVLTLTR